MNRDKIIRIAMVVCAVVVACAVIISVTDMFGNGGSLFSYANAEKYTAGDTELSGDIKKLEINWTSGKVNIAYHAENTVIVKETADKAMDDNQKLRWWLDGDTLRIQYAKSSIHIGWNLEKELTVTLPESLKLEEAKIGLTSGSLTAPDLKAEKVELDVTSGSIDASAEAETAAINATSGKVTFRLKGDADSLTVRSTSGHVSLEAEKVKEVQVGSTSGKMELHVEEAGKVSAESTSASILADVKKADKLRISSTSGSVTAAVSPEPGFTADINTVSGSVNTDVAVTRNGNRYICGDGSMEIDVSTVSGSIRIEKTQK